MEFQKQMSRRVSDLIRSISIDFRYLDLTNGHEHVSPNPPRQQQEAYCNLCERSFCNKYFLKTHFAKKHGELNLVSPLSLTETNDNGHPALTSPLSAGNDLPIPLIANHQSSPVQNKTSEDYCEVCLRHEPLKISIYFPLV